MNYQVLARKWRPRQLDDVKGQDPVVRALSNALSTQRIHHAYLFTGTRGVGKTSLARIFAKCVSCQKSISPTPCGECAICLSIDQGSYPDLIEIDAASRTRVEDTRDILSNVQFSPAMGRYKIYLIDEVHMLSTHSFNALLKTLEEPPAHVIFLLATTELQKLPATILSRCLQFNLKNVSEEKLAAHLSSILQEEKINFDQEAIQIVAKAADGSIRDALSLLEQAIAYGNQSVTINDVTNMLGMVPVEQVMKLLNALAQNESELLLKLIDEIALQGFDFAVVLEELAALFSDIALIQTVPSIGAQIREDSLSAWAEKISKEDIQLYYQIAILARRDLPLAPSPRIGFSMALIRMLNFRLGPAPAGPAPSLPSRVNDPIPAVKTESKPVSSVQWDEFIAQCSLTGVLKTLVDYTVLKEWQDNRIHLLLDPSQAATLNPRVKQRLIDELSNSLGKQVEVSITVSADKLACPARVSQEQRQQQLQQATQALQSDPQLSSLMAHFDGKMQEDSVTLTAEGIA